MVRPRFVNTYGVRTTPLSRRVSAPSMANRPECPARQHRALVGCGARGGCPAESWCRGGLHDTTHVDKCLPRGDVRMLRGFSQR